MPLLPYQSKQSVQGEGGHNSVKGSSLCVGKRSGAAGHYGHGVSALRKDKYPLAVIKKRAFLLVLELNAVASCRGRPQLHGFFAGYLKLGYLSPQIGYFSLDVSIKIFVRFNRTE